MRALLFVFLLSSQGAFAAEQPKSKELKLDDLGFSKEETLANPTLQKDLEKRSSMLKTHQILGLVTLLPMTATVLLSAGAAHGEKVRTLHMVAGISTTALYVTTASFALLAPKPAGVVDKGSSKIHRILAWIHAPLMVITPVLGALAKDRADSGRPVNFPASLHGAAGVALIATFAASAAVMAFDF